MLDCHALPRPPRTVRARSPRAVAAGGRPPHRAGTARLRACLVHKVALALTLALQVPAAVAQAAAPAAPKFTVEET